MATLVLTAIGEDRPGLVTALSDLVTAHDGNWERSEMAQMAGKFAGIVLVTVPDDRVDALMGALRSLDERGLLEVRAERAAGRASSVGERVLLHLVGSDRTGIVRDISAALASLEVSIDELATATREAPMAGGDLFEARAVLRLPEGVEVSGVRRVLEAVADELMVDLEVQPVDGDPQR
jgi:glycine cleavage system regulatory protein